MNQYQKVYMNQIHSSSLLGQLAQMWRSQMLCDALIRTGNVTTKAHRVVLVAACPMLQSMDNASVGSHLEVRLAADIKQEAVNSFLQYLYEGFMMLSEENCKDVEKVARLLQVDSVTKCCIDFYNCLQKKTGVPVYSNTQYKYSSADLLEFRHVRTTDLQKTIQERMMKRAAADSGRPASPGGKRQRTQQRPQSPNIDLAMFGQKADDTLSMAHSYMGNQSADPWERVPRLGAVHGQRTQQPKPGVIEIVEDSLEILQTQPPDKDGNKSAPPIIQKSLAISVSSQINQSSDVHVVNINDTSSHPTAATDGPIMSTGRDSITVSPLTVMPGSSSSSISSPLIKDQHKPSYDSQKEMSDRGQFAKKSQSVEHQSSTPQQRLFPVSMSPANMSPINQVSQPKKSFAAGSASQAANMSHSHESPSINKRPSSSAGSEIVDRPPSSDSGKDLGAKSKLDDGSASNSTDMAPDLSIVKVEPTIDDPGLDMYVDVPDESMIQAQQRDREHDDESDLEVEEASGDWSRDEMSNETGGNDQNNSWYIGQFKGSQPDVREDNSPLRFQMESVTCYAFDSFYGSDHGRIVSSAEGLPSCSSLTKSLTTVNDPDKKLGSLVNKNTNIVKSSKDYINPADKVRNLAKTNTTVVKSSKDCNDQHSKLQSPLKKETNVVQDSQDYVRRNPSIVGKLIPSKVLMANGIEDCSSKNKEKAPRVTKKSNRKRVLQDSKNKRSGRKGTTLRIKDKRNESSQIKKKSTQISRKIQTKSGICMKVKRGLSSSIKPLISSIKHRQNTMSSNSIKEMPLRRRLTPLKEFKLNFMRGKHDNNDEMTETNKNSTQTQTDNKSANSLKKLQVLQNYPKVFETCVPVVKLSKSQIDKATSLKSPVEKLESNFGNKDQNVSFRRGKIQEIQSKWERKFKKKHIRLKVVDSDFWNIPLNAFEGKMEYPEHFADKKVSSYFSYLLGTDVWSAIPEKFVQTALLFSKSNRTRFAMSLFQSVLSIGDVFQENAEGFVVDKIESWKINLVREVTFKYFPADYRCEDSEWKWITAYLVHSLIHSALGCVEKWFVITAIKDKQLKH